MEGLTGFRVYDHGGVVYTIRRPELTLHVRVQQKTEGAQFA